MMFHQKKRRKRKRKKHEEMVKRMFSYSFTKSSRLWNALDKTPNVFMLTPDVTPKEAL
jgi:hypothetical protein